MKLKCNDGIVRDFQVSIPSWQGIGWDDAYCKKCGYQWEASDTHLLKPLFKKHICQWKCKYCGWKGNDHEVSFNNFGEARCPNCTSGNPLEAKV